MRSASQRSALRVSTAVNVAAISAPPAVAAPASTQLALLACFMHRFAGTFDNGAQAAVDVAAGLAPREGGGHEHICCHVQRVQAPGVGPAMLADYRFPERGDQSFRTRLYTLECADPSLDCVTHGAQINMKIYRVPEERMAQLSDVSFDASAVRWSAEDFAHHIPDCDVVWTYNELGECGARYFDGELAAGEVDVFSPIMKQQIRVLDSLQLFEDALWINDRGFDLDGNQIYGNWRNVPYKLERHSGSGNND